MKHQNGRLIILTETLPGGAVFPVQTIVAAGAVGLGCCCVAGRSQDGKEQTKIGRHNNLHSVCDVLFSSIVVL